VVSFIKIRTSISERYKKLPQSAYLTMTLCGLAATLTFDLLISNLISTCFSTTATKL